MWRSPGAVDVAADGGQRCDCSERIEYPRVTHVSGVKDVLDAVQRGHGLRPQQAMCVGDDADSHRAQSPIDSRVRGIEIVAQRIAEEVEGKHAEHYRQGGKKHHMRRVKEMGTRVVEHVSPARGGRRHPETQEAERRFGQHHSRHADRRLNDQRLQDVRQNVPGEDTQV